MSLFRTLIEGFGGRRFVEGGLLTEVQGRGDAPPTTARPMSPADELALLEQQALDKGISSVELERVRRIGECPAQVQARIKQLHEWLAAH